jgi:hypothetical protein
MSAGAFLSFVRRCIYNRWFYAALAVVCLLDAITDLMDLLTPGGNDTVDLLSFIASALAALFAGAVFIDLHLRRGKP